jgi:RNA polymerase sigma-70 factor (ECF subfamily)
MNGLSREESVQVESWIRRAREGDEQAWEAIVRGHQEGVFRLAYLYLRDAREAEDVTQRAFIRAYENIDQFENDRHLRPWLLSIAANLAKNRQRSLGRYWAALRRFGAQVISPGAYNSRGRRTEPPVQSESELWHAIKRLSQMEQEIIYLRFFLDMSVRETAGTLGVAEGTVKSRLHRALQRLRGVIEAEFPGLEGYPHG